MTTKQIITVPVTLDRANRRKDKSVSLAFTTNMEITNEDFATMDLFVQNTGWLLFKRNEIDAAEIPAEQAPDESKSLSDRLRATLYVRWDLLTDHSIPFDIYRATQMEKVIGWFKKGLPEREGR